MAEPSSNIWLKIFSLPAVNTLLGILGTLIGFQVSNSIKNKTARKQNRHKIYVDLVADCDRLLRMKIALAERDFDINWLEAQKTFGIYQPKNPVANQTKEEIENIVYRKHQQSERDWEEYMAMDRGIRQNLARYEIEFGGDEILDDTIHSFLRMFPTIKDFTTNVSREEFLELSIDAEYNLLEHELKKLQEKGFEVSAALGSSFITKRPFWERGWLARTFIKKNKT